MAYYSYNICIQGKLYHYSFNVPELDDYVFTNRFCPNVFLHRDGNPILGMDPFPKNGQKKTDFNSDCNKFANYLELSDYNSQYHIDGIAVFYDALEKIVVEHVNKHGRLVFIDLLMYVDIMCYFLFADRGETAEHDIRKFYPTYVMFVINGLGDYVRDSWTLLPIQGTPMYNVVKGLCVEE